MLQAEFRDLQVDVSSFALQQLARYASEIEHWNKAVNLTALRGRALVRRLIVEPVWVGQHMQMKGSMSDVGSGNGSPGLPLHITRDFASTHLIEPRARRAAFLRHTIVKLGLTGVGVDRCRVEEMPKKAVSSDWITLQAIDPTPELTRNLRRIANETTRVVWITSVDTPPVAAAEKLEVPGGTTKIWTFSLDQI